jgi:hypothetical protein
VDEARRNLGHYGAEVKRFTFVVGDIFDVFKTAQPMADTVLCLGFFYHTLRYTELWKGMSQTGARRILIDTLIHPDSDDSVIRVVQEPTSRQGNAVADEFSPAEHVLTGRPSLAALRMMAKAYGYELTGLSDWSGLLRDNPTATGIGDYRAGRRVTAAFAR